MWDTQERCGNMPCTEFPVVPDSPTTEDGDGIMEMHSDWDWTIPVHAHHQRKNGSRSHTSVAGENRQQSNEGTAASTTRPRAGRGGTSFAQRQRRLLRRQPDMHMKPAQVLSAIVSFFGGRGVVECVFDCYSPDSIIRPWVNRDGVVAGWSDV